MASPSSASQRSILLLEDIDAAVNFVGKRGGGGDDKKKKKKKKEKNNNKERRSEKESVCTLSSTRERVCVL